MCSRKIVLTVRLIYEYPATIWVEIWDDDKFKKDDFIGRTAIVLEDKDDKTIVEEWRKLEAKYVAV